MTEDKRLTLIGNTPSPYTQKMLALLRYRHIPYSVIWGNPTDVLQAMGIDLPKVALLPTFIFEDQEKPYSMVDSTPIIRKLEQDFSGRSVIPSSPALAFIDYLLEDFADEWVTKFMFHFRWHLSDDADNAGTLLPLCLDPSMPSDKHIWAKEHFSKRQIERLYVVGSNDITAATIEASYTRFLRVMEAHLAHQPYLLGARPGASDFALYGQLTALIGFDPTPRKLAHELSPRSVAWISLLEDLSGLNPSDQDWRPIDEQPDTLKDLLAEIGRGYAPALLANARALQAGEKQWEAEIDGARWTQPSFPYQGRCLQWINQQYQALSNIDQQQVDQLLAGTGCEQLILRG